MKNIIILIFLCVISAFAQTKPGDGTLPVLRSIQIHTIQGPLHLPREININVNESLHKDKVIIKKVKIGSELEKITISMNHRLEVQVTLETEINAHFQNLQIRPLSQDNFISKARLGDIVVEREIVLIWE